METSSKRASGFGGGKMLDLESVEKKPQVEL
jgi:hypothetical protein